MIEEYREEMINSFTVGIQAGEIHEYRSKDLAKNSVRVFNQGQILSANALGEISKEELKRKALNNDVGASSFTYQYNANEKMVFHDDNNTSHNELITLANETIELVKERLPMFLVSGKIEWFRNKTTIENSLGARLEQGRALGAGFLLLKRKGSANILDSAIGLSFRDTSFLKHLDLNFKFQEMFDHEVSIDNGEFPVVFVGESNMGFMKKFQESLMPDKYFQNAAFYSGKLDEEIFHPNLSMSDFRHGQETAKKYFFNDECELLNEKVEVIKNGVFKTVLSDKLSANKYQINNTGNGRREYNREISPMPYHLTFESNDESHRDIFDKYPKLVVVFMSGGGSTDSNGEYSAPAQLSFLVEDGKIKGRLPQITLAQNIDQIFGEKFICVPKDNISKNFEKSFVTRMNIFN